MPRGDSRAGLEELRGGLEEAGEARFLPRFLLLLGEVAACFGAAGEIAMGLETVNDAITRCEDRDEGWYIPELFRIRGELALWQGGADSAAASEQNLRRALDWAHRHGALAWELRAATSLARLWRDQGKSADARGILRPVYDRFTEGFETADLRSAIALLDTLR